MRSCRCGCRCGYGWRIIGRPILHRHIFCWRMGVLALQGCAQPGPGALPPGEGQRAIFRDAGHVAVPGEVGEEAGPIARGGPRANAPFFRRFAQQNSAGSCIHPSGILCETALAPSEQAMSSAKGDQLPGGGGQPASTCFPALSSQSGCRKFSVGSM